MKSTILNPPSPSTFHIDCKKYEIFCPYCNTWETIIGHVSDGSCFLHCDHEVKAEYINERTRKEIFTERGSKE